MKYAVRGAHGKYMVTTITDPPKCNVVSVVCVCDNEDTAILIMEAMTKHVPL